MRRISRLVLLGRGKALPPLRFEKHAFRGDDGMSKNGAYAMKVAQLLMAIFVVLVEPAIAAEPCRIQMFYFINVMGIGGTRPPFECESGFSPNDRFQTRYRAMRCRINNFDQARSARLVLRELQSKGSISVPPDQAESARQYFLIRPDGRGAYGERVVVLESEQNSCGALANFREFLNREAEEKKRREVLCTQLTIQEYRVQAACGEDTALEALERALGEMGGR